MKKSCRIALGMLTAAVVLVGAGMLTSCEPDYGDPVTKTISIPAYAAINIQDAFEVEMIPGIAEPTLTVDEGLMDKVDIHVDDNGMLFVRLNNISWTRGIKAMKLMLPYNPDLVKVVASGASGFDAQGEYPIQELDLSGVSSAHFKTTDMKEIVLSGMSMARVIGVGDVIRIAISGASQLDAKELLCSEVNGTVSGASAVDVTVCSKLALEVSGASDVTYALVSPTCNLDNSCNVTGNSAVSQRN